MANRQRSVKNMFVQPEFQMKTSLYFIGIGGLILVAVGLVVLNKLGDVQALMNNGSEMNFLVQSHVNDLMLECVQYALLGFVIFILFSFCFALVISHRVSGPQVAIKAYIEALKKGDYEYNRNLRPHDELSSIMDALKELKTVLKDRGNTAD